MSYRTAYIAAHPKSGHLSVIRDYLLLTKPTIMLLVLFTAVTALVVEGSLMSRPGELLLLLLGIFLTGGSANALNQLLEQKIDARMTRTSQRRPLPSDRLSAVQALMFALSIGTVGLAILWYFFNLLSAALALATILFYSLFYTLVLKPKTSQNIVIGGAAGAMAPVGAWAAVTGGTHWIPWILFAIVFLWTPPHFWALALAYKEDYVRAKLPMMPVVKGDASTYNQIIFYTWLTVAVSLLLPLWGSGWSYLIIAALLGGLMLQKAYRARRSGEERDQKRLFGFSIIYLFGLYSGVMLDAWLGFRI